MAAEASQILSGRKGLAVKQHSQGGDGDGSCKIALQPAKSAETDPSLALDLWSDSQLKSCMASIFLLNHITIQKYEPCLY